MDRAININLTLTLAVCSSLRPSAHPADPRPYAHPAHPRPYDHRPSTHDHATGYYQLQLTSTQLKHWDFRLDCSGQLPCRAFAANLDQAAFLQSSPVGSTIDTPEDLAARNYSDRNLANSVVRMATDGVQALGEQHDHAHKVPVGTSKQTHVMQRCFSSCPRVQEQDIDHPLNTMITIDAMCKKLCIKTTQQVAQQMTPDGPSSAKSIGECLVASL